MIHRTVISRPDFCLNCGHDLDYIVFGPFSANWITESVFGLFTPAWFPTPLCVGPPGQLERLCEVVGKAKGL